MQTKSKEKINIVTLGCAKNIVDSEVLLTQLKGNEKKAFHQRDDINPDVVIINTCGFIDNAKAPAAPVPEWLIKSGLKFKILLA